MPILRVDSNFTVIEAALKGYMKWRASHGSKPQQDVSYQEP
jgi:exportin-5